MSHRLPKLSHLSDRVGDEPIRRKSGTRRASRAKFDDLGGEERERDSERPTVPVPRSGRVVRGTDAPLCSDGASVDVSPTEGTLSDLVARLGPARSLEAPVAEEPSFDVRPTLPSILLPVPIHPEPAADDPPGFVPALHRRRRLPRSRRHVVAAAVVLGFMAVIVEIGRSGSPAGPALTAGGPVASEALPGGSTVRPAASARLQVERISDESTTPVTELPAALPVASTKPASQVRAPAPAPPPARAQKGPRPPPKRSNDVDFGI
jgi:hypothetical protein